VQQVRNRLFPGGDRAPVLGGLARFGFLVAHRVDADFLFTESGEIVVALFVLLVGGPGSRCACGHRFTCGTVTFVARTAITVAPSAPSSATVASTPICSGSIRARAIFDRTRSLGHRVVDILRFGLVVGRFFVGGASEIVGSTGIGTFRATTASTTAATTAAGTVVSTFGGLGRFGRLLGGFLVVTQQFVQTAEVVVGGFVRRFDGFAIRRGAPFDAFRDVTTEIVSPEAVARRSRRTTSRRIRPAPTPVTPVGVCTIRTTTRGSFTARFLCGSPSRTRFVATRLFAYGSGLFATHFFTGSDIARFAATAA
jgi:hypothetical protein